MAHEPWTALTDGVLLDVRLTPRGGRDAIEEIENRTDCRAVLKARVRAGPFDGQANAALRRLLAASLKTAARQVTLVAGASARVNRIRVAGDAITVIAALRRLAEAGS